jgi:hypothetical protein
MTTGGYIFLVVGWGIVLCFAAFAMARFLGRRKK